MREDDLRRIWEDLLPKLSNCTVCGVFVFLLSCQGLKSSHSATADSSREVRELQQHQELWSPATPFGHWIWLVDS